MSAGSRDERAPRSPRHLADLPALASAKDQPSRERLGRLRQNWFSNTAVESHGAVIEAARAARPKLVAH
jgi:hypothetical protein